MTLGLLAAFALVAANGFFVATEFSLARLRPTQVSDFLRDGVPGAKSTDHAVRHIDSYLAACQLGITLASLGLGVVGKPVFRDLLEPVLGARSEIAGFGVASALAFLTITLLHVVLGELSPKSLAIARTGRTALFLAPPMRLFYLATKPFVDFFNLLGNLVLKPFGVPPAREAGHSPHSEEEIRELLRQSGELGLLESEESALSERALLFGDIRAREVMRPRPEIDFVTTADDTRRVAEVALETGRTRLPLCEPEGLDACIGVLNAKDLLPLAFGREQVDLRSIARPIARVSESTRVDEVLREMRGKRRHIALVLDEHGTVIGLLTLEDIIEQIIGEIEDEFDVAAEELIVVDDGTMTIDGSAPLRLVAERLGIEIEAPHESTIGGHVVEEVGRVPDEGEIIELYERSFEVCSVDDARVTQLCIRDVPAAATGDAAGPG
jgi:CBS domain containing-hemolysin-like protein